MRSSFNAWKAKNVIGGQKYVVVMTILKMSRTERCSHGIYDHFRIIKVSLQLNFVFEFQTLGCKLNPVSREKISLTFALNTEKTAQLTSEEMQ